MGLGWVRFFPSIYQYSKIFCTKNPKERLGKLECLDLTLSGYTLTPFRECIIQDYSRRWERGKKIDFDELVFRKFANIAIWIRDTMSTRMTCPGGQAGDSPAVLHPKSQSRSAILIPHPNMEYYPCNIQQKRQKYWIQSTSRQQWWDGGKGRWQIRNRHGGAREEYPEGRPPTLFPVGLHKVGPVHWEVPFTTCGRCSS